MFAYSNSPWATQHTPSQRTTAQVKLTNAVDQMASLFGMPDYHSNATFGNGDGVPNYNGGFVIPHNPATCTAHNQLVGHGECVDGRTTYIDMYHDLRSYGTRSIIGATPAINPLRKANLHHFVVTGYLQVASDGKCNTDTLIGPIYVWAPGAAYMILPEFLGVKINGGDGVKCIAVQTHCKPSTVLLYTVSSHRHF